MRWRDQATLRPVALLAAAAVAAAAEYGGAPAEVELAAADVAGSTAGGGTPTATPRACYHKKHWSSATGHRVCVRDGPSAAIGRELQAGWIVGGVVALALPALGAVCFCSPRQRRRCTGRVSRSQGYSLVATEEEEFASWGYGVDEDELAFGFDDDNGGAEGCCSAGCCSGLTDHAKVLVIAICAFACITVAQTVRRHNLYHLPRPARSRCREAGLLTAARTHRWRR